MEEHRGLERGSYIWGRSVHNTRIERLWYDVTHGFGFKWKQFIIDLEFHHDLNPSLPAHIWLLHHLFLDSVNQDAQEWAAAWNSHHLQIRGERGRSPRDMFITYGIDWDVANDPGLMTHLLDQNPQDWSERNLFAPGLDTLSHVPCEPPNSPFTVEQIAFIDAELAAEVDVTSRSMHVRRVVWTKAMELCNRFYE
ncbi:hypothetical protein DFH09DRAFT_1462008 [Mycena vulgaris]|nr:hypothetical protein DFH09DRAFT_1473192 [Mycena vulgaris]KAJ6572492.1 hypothetical protein DFH09DRAFT_1462008 [Mycena vulgaris]